MKWFWFRNNFIDFLSVAGAWLFCPQNFYQYTLRFKSDPYDSSDFLVGDFGFISLRLEFSFTKVDYVWSLKLVLIQHSPWLLLVKIKCQLQNTWKIELWNKSEGWPHLTSHLPNQGAERDIPVSVWRTEFYQSFYWLLSVLNILWVSQVL